MSTRTIKHLFVTFLTAGIILAIASAASIYKAPTTISKTYGPSCTHCLDIREFDHTVRDLSLFRSLATTTATALLLSAIFGLLLLERQPKKRVPKREPKKSK